MTQKSYPWPGVAPGSGADAGRYTAPEWWGEWATEQLTSGVIVTSPLLRPSAVFTNVGVHYAVANQLAVTSPANNQVTIATGAWTNDGQFGYNDTALSAIAVTSPAANPRIDRVIIRKNYTGNTYTPTNAAALTVPPYTARVTVVSGAEAVGPTAPALIQDTARNPAGAFGTDGTWDIPLAQYEISVGGVISSLTDEREWVDMEIKSVLVVADYGRNVTDGAYLDGYVGGVGSAFGLDFVDAKNCQAYGHWVIPPDYISTLTSTALYHPPLTGGDMVCQNWIYRGVCGGSPAADSNTSAQQTIAVAQFVYECLLETAEPANTAIGDFLVLLANRRGDLGADTVANSVEFVGWEINYLGWKR